MQICKDKEWALGSKNKMLLSSQPLSISKFFLFMASLFNVFNIQSV